MESILDSLRSESYAIQLPENDFIIEQPVFTVFPNPFTDNIEIHTGIKGDEFMCKVQVYNLQGSLIYSANTACNGGQINTGAWKPGMYMLQIDKSNTGERMTQRIFKMDK